MTAISDFKDIHKGKRLFVLASGPSLADLDLSRLKHRIVMGLNRSVLTYPETHYHCTMDLRLFEEYGDLLKRARYLFTFEGRPWGIPLKLLGGEGFSWDLEKGIYSGYTVSYFALQIAVYMGFKEIVFLGLDLKNQGRQTHFFGSDFHSIGHDDTEFPKMKRMLGFAARELRESGITVYNCSPVCELDCFPKVTYDYAVSL